LGVYDKLTASDGDRISTQNLSVLCAGERAHEELLAGLDLVGGRRQRRRVRLEQPEALLRELHLLLVPPDLLLELLYVGVHRHFITAPTEDERNKHTQIKKKNETVARSVL
jgi:hypothetical protein